MNKNAIAVVGVGAIMPDANNAKQFWQNILTQKYSIREVPENRWSAEMYYHPDPAIPDKTYSKIGSWVENLKFNPFEWGIMIPPSVLSNMDEGQKWAIAASHQALIDYGYPEKTLPADRVAVILGNAMAGEKHYKTNLRIHAPKFSQALASVPAFQSLSIDQQKALKVGMLDAIYAELPPINEDTMPGELSNIIAGRVANVFNFGGANFVTDAACASSMAALQAAVEGLISYQFDAVLTGGIDRNNGAGSFVKFSKIGALSPDGSRPYADGANGFVMGEGAAVFLLKRLEDAERDKDKIYAVIRGIGSSSDGKGKGITAPNPIGQERALIRAWERSGVDPATVSLIEGHGTSTRVGDKVEAQGLTTIFGNLGIPTHSVGLGSVKSNIGHLKSAAGAAGLLKVFFALHEKVLPPSANFHKPNPGIDFDHSPFFVVTEQRSWDKPTGDVRRAGVSAFGFGGTNFHVVVEEYIPGLLNQAETISTNTMSTSSKPQKEPVMTTQKPGNYDHMLMLDGDNSGQLLSQLTVFLENAKNGKLPEDRLPTTLKPERLVISYTDTAELVKRGEKALAGLSKDKQTPWKAYATQGIYRSSSAPGKVAFLFPGQGSQYANMLRDLAEIEPIVAETYAEADRVMEPLLGKPLTSYIFAENDEESIAEAEKALKNTSITQPSVLTADVALMRLLMQRGFQPDMLIGHSLGEYAALVAAEALTFEEALIVVSARGDAMAKLEVEDNGCMAAVRAPIKEVERLLGEIDGYVTLANINSPMQSVVGGNTKAVETAIEVFAEAGFQAVKIPVSHAFHTRIVAPASKPLREMIESTNLQPPKLPIAANVTGKLYPSTQIEITDMLGEHIASSVQFVKGIETLYQEGARIFVEAGPKRVLNSLAVDILKEQPDVTVIATNHPRKGGIATFHEAVCQLYAAGLGVSVEVKENNISHQQQTPTTLTQTEEMPSHFKISGSVVISGAGLGLPGKDGHIFGDDQIERILNGESFIDPLPQELRQEILNKRVTRLEKSNAGAQMVTIDHFDQTIKLAGQPGKFDLNQEFGIPEERVNALDISTQLAIAAGIEALRDAGIPLVMRYKETSTGSFLPKRWMLPESLADETGVIFGSAFPGLDRLAEAADEYYEHRQIKAQIDELKTLLTSVLPGSNGLAETIQQRINILQEQLGSLDYHFDRKFVFRVLTMGHSQFAEYIGARGPNTAVNAACATTTHALSIAEDWIRTGRCCRVVIVAGDNVTGGHLAEWIAPGLLASGATTTEGDLQKAALPFDLRRNGMIMGMGAAGLVVESEDAVRERGMTGICEVLATDTANSAFHGTRLDVEHVSMVMERVISTAEKRFGIPRNKIANQAMFMSHETYTPARGGSAAAEIYSLRNTFGDHANNVLVANTKGFTGHTMGVGIEDVVAVKSLQHGIVPPIAHLNENFEPDPQLGNLNLSQGGTSNVQFALRLGAGFGSQIAMALFRRIPGTTTRIDQAIYQNWLAKAAGYQNAELETVQRTLRIKDQGQPANKPAASTWVYGTGPTKWADQPTLQKTEKVMQTSMQEPVIEVTKSPVEGSNSIVDPSPNMIQVDREEVKAFLLGLVSEKTGYPQEVLDLELDLEADLGIDTVKQAELFAAVRENYGIPRREDLMLVDYNTLDKVIGFVEDSLAEMGTEVQIPVEENITEPAPTQPAPSIQVDREEVKAFLLGLVSEKTGYPQEVLDLELDLEADLGIDTVKQAELFAAVRENYGIPRREDLMLVDYNTLDKVITFVEDSLSETGPPAEEQLVEENSDTIQAIKESEPNLPEKEDPADPVIQPQAESIDEENHLYEKTNQQSTIQRRVPVPILRPRLDLCAPTGITLDGTKRVLIVEDHGPGAEALVDILLKKRVEILRIRKPDPETIELHVKQWLEEDKIDGVYFIAGLEPERPLSQQSLEDWQAMLQDSVYSLYHLMRLLPEDTFLISTTAVGSLNGYGGESAYNTGGGISGFTKALAMEHPNTLTKVIDFHPDTPPETIAAKLIGETLNDPTVTEVGYEEGQRYNITVVERPFTQNANYEIPAGSVFLVSGGTGGITLPILLDLAEKTSGRFYLLGRSPLPSADDVDIRVLQREGEKALQNKLLQQAKETGNNLTPVEAKEQVEKLSRSADTLAAIEKIKKLGGKAHYLTVELTEKSSVENAVSKVLQEEGHVDILIHAAGIERSRKLERKPLDEFSNTIEIKATGFFHLFKALQNRHNLPKTIVLFSSIAGRFGNSGQTDYSAANDLLAKLGSSLSRQYPSMRIATLDWGPWAEVGMASRGAIPRLMSMAGIEMMPPKEAAKMVYQEITHGQGHEAIFSGSLGVLAEKNDLTPTLDIELANQALRSGDPIHIMLSNVTGFDPENGVTLEVTLDPEQEPFLHDHALDGTPLLPGVMGIEGFSVAAQYIASVLGAGDDYSFRVARLEDVQFQRGFKFYRNEPRHIIWKALPLWESNGLVVSVTLESQRPIHLGESKTRLHFSGKAYLQPTQQPLQSVAGAPPKWNGGYTLVNEDIYKLYFHGPAFRVLEAIQKEGSQIIGKLRKDLPPFTSHPVNLDTTPLLIELCLQTAGIWETSITGNISLPHTIGKVSLYRQVTNGVPVFAKVEPTQTEDGMSFNSQVIDAKGRVYLELKDYRTVSLPRPVDQALLTPLQKLISQE